MHQAELRKSMRIAASTLVPDRWALSQNKAYYIRKKKR